MSSYFFLQANKKPTNADLISKLEEYSEVNKEQIYIVDRPLGDNKYSYSYTDALIILAPKNKIAIIDCGNGGSKFEDYVEDIIEDLGSISDKYLYKDIIGRPRTWRETLFETNIKLQEIKNVKSLLEELNLSNPKDKKRAELLISLFTGSINDITKVKAEVPETTLDKVKQKIQLFDGDQTRFIYEKLDKKIIRIQGLSGTGKTELLLHKLKEIYTSDNSSKIYFTCHNKILADTLKQRIPDFFNFMKVEQQIVWNSRLWCTGAWGSNSYVHSGAYKYITSFYQIPFYRYSYQTSFKEACKQAIMALKDKFEMGEMPYAFDYMFVDESQDFADEFFELCSMVTRNNIYVAGDIFQSIFDRQISSNIKPDYLLGKCYRTDPKTLMFAHALGMGLFEEPKLRWLEEKEWRDCGYNVKIDSAKDFHLSREPLRRFEDIDPTFESMEIVELDEEESPEKKILQIVKQIINENPTVLPDDVGIIYLDDSKGIYRAIDTLAILIKQNLTWPVNIAYETKEKVSGSIFISNRNNVKGLEFPFVICVTRRLVRYPSYRNALYTMLSRSFIKTYLLVQDEDCAELLNKLEDGLEQILKTNEMIITEPTPEEKEKIKTTFEYEIKKGSYYDVMKKIFEKHKIEDKYHERLFSSSLEFEMTDKDEETLTNWVLDNLKYLDR